MMSSIQLNLSNFISPSNRKCFNEFNFVKWRQALFWMLFNASGRRLIKKKEEKKEAFTNALEIAHPLELKILSVLRLLKI